MQALGLIETKGLLAAIESADTMLKAADVTLMEKTYVGGGLVTITVTGEVSAVSAAVEAGAYAVRQLNQELIFAQHVIPRPDDELAILVKSIKPTEEMETPSIEFEIDSISEKEETEQAVESVANVETEEHKDSSTEKSEEPLVLKIEAPSSKIVKKDNEPLISEKMEKDALHKQKIDQLVHKIGLNETIGKLNELKVVTLRRILREYKDLGIPGRTISKADKTSLVDWLRGYYSKSINSEIDK